MSLWLGLVAGAVAEPVAFLIIHNAPASTEWPILVIGAGAVG